MLAGWITENPKRRDAAGWLAALVVAALLGCQTIYEPDAYWNLAGGRLVLTGVLPAVNTFAHTFPDHPWDYTSWLYGVLAALVNGAFGDRGMTLLSIATATGFSALLTFAARQSPAFRWRFHLPVLALALVAIQYRFQPRGDNATMLGLAALPVLWARRGRLTPLWALLLAAVWTNMHSGVVYGIIVWCVYLGLALVARNRGDAKAAALALGAFVAGSLANPTGPYAYFASVAGDYSFFAGMVSELRRVPPFEFPTIYFFWLLGAAACVEALSRRDYAFAILFTGFGLSALFGGRFAVFSVAVGAPGVGLYLGGIFDRIRNPRAAAAAALLLVGAGVACAQSETRKYMRLEDYGVGASPRHFPVAASEFIERAGLPGDFFNEFNYGGYLAGRFYPSRRVYIDGRMLAYPKEFYVRTIEPPIVSLPEQMDDYPLAHIAVVQRRGEGAQYEEIFDAMGWKQVFADRAATVFVRPGTPAEREGEKYELQIIKLWQPEAALFQNVAFNRARALAELDTMRLREFFLPHDFYALSRSALLAGDRELAEEFIKKGIARHPDHAKLREEYENYKRSGR